MKYLEEGSTEVAEQGGLKAEVVTRQQAISDEGSGERRRRGVSEPSDDDDLDWTDL